MSATREVIGAGSYGYIAGYNGREVEIWAPSLFSASQQAQAYFKPAKSRRYEVWVRLCETPQGPVVHVADF